MICSPEKAKRREVRKRGADTASTQRLRRGYGVLSHGTEGTAQGETQACCNGHRVSCANAGDRGGNPDPPQNRSREGSLPDLLIRVKRGNTCT